jgi:hypothetical protein
MVFLTVTTIHRTKFWKVVRISFSCAFAMERIVEASLLAGWILARKETKLA